MDGVVCVDDVEVTIDEVAQADFVARVEGVDCALGVSGDACSCLVDEACDIGVWDLGPIVGDVDDGVGEPELFRGGQYFLAEGVGCRGAGLRVPL